ncbi:MAG: tetratricopeptide repeat protein [Acidobacteriota bacterium]|nr:tetratricopeptide repeat protein [Acidobacteriota bacterium]
MVRWVPFLFLLLFSCLPLNAADTIAVLPLFNDSQTSASSLDWVGESVAETIREAISRSGKLVLEREDRTEVYHRLGVRSGAVLTKATVMRIAEALDAGQVIYGDFDVGADETGARTPKSGMRIALHILDLKKLKESPVIEQLGPLQNLSQMETNIEWFVLHALDPDSVPTLEEFVKGRPPVRVEAMESYVRGLMAPNADQQIRLFQQSARLDDRFSQPAFQLGRLYFQRKDYKTAESWLSKVSKSDSHFMEGSFLLGICRYYGGDYDGAVQQLRMVQAELPLNEVFNDLGAALSRKNDPAAADNFRKALEGDEADPDYWFNLGFALWKKQDFTDAADKFRAVLDRSAGDQEATFFLGRCLQQVGPRPGDPRSEGRERIKTTFEDSAYRQLQAELKTKTK